MPVYKDDFFTMRRDIMSEKDETLQAAYYFCINRCSFSGSTLCGEYSSEAAEKRLTKSTITTLIIRIKKNQ